MNESMQTTNQKVLPQEGFRKAVILGAGESGTGAAILAKKLGFDVFLSDSGSIKENYKQELAAAEIAFEENGHSIDRILSADLIIKSPGIPDKVQLIKDLKAKGIPIWSEIEFASRYTDTKIIAITGSNGKTTTTSLTHHIFEKCGFDTQVGGNIGFSFARLVANEMERNESRKSKVENQELSIKHLPLLGKSSHSGEDLGGAFREVFYILEISSFQLDNCYHFAPDISMILNITPDHLDRYEYDINKYIASKFRITQAQTEQDFFIYNADNQNTTDFLTTKYNSKAQKIIVKKSLYDIGILRFPEYNLEFNLKGTMLKGEHNWFNAYCAVKAALLSGGKSEDIQKGLETFSPVAHRLEFVAEINGIEYINDSKATNVDSVFYALGAMDKPTVLILGGQDKGNDYDQIADLVREKVKCIVCMGVDNSPIIEYFKDFGIPIIATSSVGAALAAAQHHAIPNDVVLLSPACASFDLFKNYEDRGEQFKNIVLNS
jgi:UDP-N-acetylmuramoylalanine--D-glutamate ligase